MCKVGNLDIDRVVGIILDYLEDDNLQQMRDSFTKGYDINNKYVIHEPLLHYIVNYGTVAMARLALEHGADIYLESSVNNNAVQEAAGLGKIDILKLFKEKRYDFAEDVKEKDSYLLLAAESAIDGYYLPITGNRKANPELALKTIKYLIEEVKIDINRPVLVKADFNRISVIKEDLIGNILHFFSIMIEKQIYH